ncbi:MAG: GNAT family N-acetyltransferase [Propionibacteriaceae bacterium]|jgi:RimJ/RimL family protein N-acetyltransferase|nr:GNAT family N-acetyltransferase [Propionibacteriaceae bacterium]
MERFMLTPVVAAELGRVRLTPVRASDTERVYQICQHPAIQAYTTLPSPYEHEHAVSFCEELTRRAWQAFGAGGLPALAGLEWRELVWAIRLSPEPGDDDGLVGCVGIKAWFNPNGESAGYGEIGYWLDERYWHRGLMTAAVKRVLEFAFYPDGLLDYDRVTWRAHLENHASKAVAQRCGFHYTGPTECDGHPAWSAEIRRGDPMEPDDSWQ